MVEVKFDAADLDNDVITEEDLKKWEDLKKEKASITFQESVLRKRIIKYFFPAPKEGTNKTDLGTGRGLKLTHKLDRSIDIAMLTNLAPQFRELGGNIDEVVEAKPVLRTANYRKLPDNLKVIFEQCIETKPASPQLEFYDVKK